MSATLGLIAGKGLFPRCVAREAAARGQRVVAVAYRHFADPALEAEVDELHWLHVGELGALVETLRKAGVEDAVLAGQVPKLELYANAASLRFDAQALALLSSLEDRRDHSILGAVADFLAEQGLQLRPQAEWIPDLIAGPGPLGATAPSPEALADLRFGWSLARQMAAAQVGQTVVVKDRAVLAVEAIEGTDAAIRRGGELGGPGATVVKVVKPGQDPRFDLPTIGPATVAELVAIGAALLAVEAGGTVVLERARLAESADAAGLALLGVPQAGPGALP